MWLSLISLKFVLCALALTNAILSKTDLSSCIYKFTRPLISSYDDLYYYDDEVDYSYDNDDLYGDFEEEEEGLKASVKAFIAHDANRLYLPRVNPFTRTGHNKQGNPNFIAYDGFAKRDEERKKAHRNRMEKEKKEIRILQQAEALERNTKRIEEREWRRFITHLKAVDEARKLTVGICMMPTSSTYSLRLRKPPTHIGNTVVDTFPM